MLSLHLTVYPRIKLKLQYNLRYVMKSDMGDPELSFWMREPNMFYIATPTSDENRIFGLVGCSKISDTVAELFRLTVIPEAR